MNIRCPDCNAENQLGAIFCRECGAKLDVEKFKPQVRDSANLGGLFGFIRKIIGLILFFGAIAVLGLMFWPGDAAVPALDEKNEKAADAKFVKLKNRLANRFGESTFVFSPAEISYIFDKHLVERTEDGEIVPQYLIQSMAVEITPSKLVRATIRTKFFGSSVPVTFEILGVLNQVDDPEKGAIPVTFKITETKMGHMKVPGFLSEKVVEKFRPLIQDDFTDEVLKAAGAIAINDQNSFVLSLRRN